MKQQLYVLIAAALLFLSSSLTAAYLTDVPQTIAQPDGTIIHCLATGDEFYNWLHDENGYTIVQDKNTGYYFYGIRSGADLVPSEYLVGKINPADVGLEPWINIDTERMVEIREQFMKNEMPTRPELEGYALSAAAGEFDEINNVVVYIRFSNQFEYQTDTMYYYDMYNNETEGYNSMKNYFKDVSYGELDMPSWFYPVPPGPKVISYQDIYPRSYYMPYSSSNPDGYQGNQRGQREHALLKRAIEYIQNEVPESINLDDNNDGFVDNVIFCVKGQPTAWSTLLWPHRWALYNEEVYINNKRVWDYNFQMESELDTRGNGVLCHETYHTLGAPDLYHYNTAPITAVGRWDVMESNSNPPQSMGAYMKYRYGGWISEIPEINECGIYTLNPVTSPENNCFKIPSPNSNSEYFVVEYRKREGTFEGSLPGSGLLVYRIDTKLDGNGNAQGPPDEVFIFRPNGAPDKNGDLNSANLSADVGRTEVNDSSATYTYLQNGALGGLNIKNIGSVGETISFEVVFEKEPVADFISVVDLVTPECPVDFFDLSGCNVDAWEWTFEGGTPSTSSEQNPEGIIFSSAGSYSVTLKATNAYGSNSITYTDLISVSETALPQVAFESADTMVCTGKPVQFTDQTQVCPESWEWTISPDTYTFAENSTGNSRNPEIIFQESGNYTITLEVANANGSASLTREKYIKAGGNELPFFDDFESASFNAQGWTTHSPTGAEAKWATQYATGNGGSFAAGINLFDSFNFLERNQLISPLINMSGLETAVLTFDHAYTLTGESAEYSDTLVVKISSDCGETWTRLLDLYENGEGSFMTRDPLSTPFIPAVADDWCGTDKDSNCYSIDLSQWIGSENVLLMFEAVRILGNNLYIDNVRIDALTDVAEKVIENGESISVYPNPTTGQFTIEPDQNTAIKDISVLNLHGQLVTQLITSKGQQKIRLDLSSQPKGMYFVNVNTSSGTITEKVLVK